MHVSLSAYSTHFTHVSGLRTRVLAHVYWTAETARGRLTPQVPCEPGLCLLTGGQREVPRSQVVTQVQLGTCVLQSTASVRTP